MNSSHHSLPLESIPNFPRKWDVWSCISRNVWGDQLQSCCRLPLSSNACWLPVCRIGKIGKHHVNDLSAVWLRISFSASLLFVSVCEGESLNSSCVGGFPGYHGNGNMSTHTHIYTKLTQAHYNNIFKQSKLNVFSFVSHSQPLEEFFGSCKQVSIHKGAIAAWL